MQSLQRIKKHFGSQAELARVLEITPMSVSHWHKRGIPIKWAIKIERLTNGDIKAAELRPDIFA